MNNKITSSDFTSFDGTKLFYKIHQPESTAKSIFVLIHGVGEYSDRHSSLIEKLIKTGNTVFAMDLRGHGRSQGRRGFINKFEDYIKDLEIFLQIANDEKNNIPTVLYGFSLGGLISLYTAANYQNLYDKLILSSGGFGTQFEVPGWKIFLARIFDRLYPQASLPSGLVKNAKDDPLLNDRLSARLTMEFFKRTEKDKLLSTAKKITKPTLVIHAKDDPTAPVRMSEYIFDNLASKDKKLKIINSNNHHLAIEGNKEFFDTITSWVISQS